MTEQRQVLPLVEWRKRRFLTQQELADKVGVSDTTISHWETGAKPPRLRNIRRLADALGIAPEQITFPLPKNAPVAA